jgi:hypothetical protein
MGAPLVTLSLSDLPGVIRDSVASVLAAHKLHLAVALPDGDAGRPPLGELVGVDRTTAVLLEIGNNVAQALLCTAEADEAEAPAAKSSVVVALHVGENDYRTKVLGQSSIAGAHGCTHLTRDCCRGRKVCQHGVSCSHGPCCHSCWEHRCPENAPISDGASS